MPLKDIEKRREYQKLMKRKIRAEARGEIEKSNDTLYTFYQIKCKNACILDSYVGQTKNFAKRICLHKKAYNDHDAQYKLYSFMLHNGGWDNFYFERICEIKLTTLQEALDIENKFICDLNPSLNTIKSFHNINVLNDKVGSLSVPERNPFIHDIMRFELLFDTIQMREFLSQKTRFNSWMEKQINVLDELKEFYIKGASLYKL